MRKLIKYIPKSFLMICKIVNKNVELTKWSYLSGEHRIESRDNLAQHAGYRRSEAHLARLVDF